MKLVMLTDLHLAAPGVRVGGRDPRANLERALADVGAWHRDAALVVLNGDLCEDPSAETYRWLRARLDASGLRHALTIGNHDDRALFLATFPEAGTDGLAQSVHDLAEGTAVLLDTVDGPLAGRLGPDRLAWADAAIRAARPPVWLFLHHNPIPTHIAPVDRIMLADHAAFARLVVRHRERIGYIFHGHTHLPMAGALCGVPVVSGRGTAQAGFPHFGAERLAPPADLPAAYSVIQTDGLSVSVMMVEFGAAAAGARPPAD